MHNVLKLLRIIYNIIKASEYQPNKFMRQISSTTKNIEKYILLTVNFYTPDICGYYRIWLILSINWMIFVYPWTSNRKKNNKLKHFHTSRSISDIWSFYNSEKPIILLRGALIFRKFLKSSNIYFFISFSGNLLTVVALLRCPKLRSHATTMFVISLAMSDLLFSTINLPLTASRYIHEDWKLGVPMCRWVIKNLFMCH